MKPASAAYGVDNNERLGYYYAGGPQYGPPYPPYGDYDHAGNPHHHPPSAPYPYAQDGGEEGDGNAEMEGDGEGDGDHEVYTSRQGGGAVSTSLCFSLLHMVDGPQTCLHIPSCLSPLGSIINPPLSVALWPTTE